MNLPNKLSFLRVALVPVLVLCMYMEGTPGCVLSLIVFMAASFTDYLDGHIARKNQIVTTLGKFIDPLADKLLILSALIMLVSRGLLPGWVVVVVLFRELAIDGLRLIAAKEGVVIAAGIYGKIKTVTQMATIITLLCTPFWPFLHIPAQVLTVLMVIITIYSGADYFYHNGKLLFQKEEGSNV